MAAIETKQLVPKGCAALCYEREGNTKFRDRVTVFYDGKLVFERFCWGEAAGLVFAAWADDVGADGAIQWRRTLDAAVKEDALPQTVCEASRDALRFDGPPARWLLEDTKTSDPIHGYSGLKVLLGRLCG